MPYDDLSRDYSADGNKGIPPVTLKDRRAIIGLYREAIKNYLEAIDSPDEQIDPYEVMRSDVVRSDPQYLQAVSDLAKLFASRRLLNLKQETTDEATGESLSELEVLLEGVRLGAVLARTVDKRQFESAVQPQLELDV